MKPKTFEELKKIDSHQKREYFDDILFQDAKLDAYLENQKIQIAKLQKDIKEVEESIDSELDEWNENLEEVN